LLNSLPKSIRKKLIPINSTVNQLLDDIEFGRGSLLASLERSILKQFSFLIHRTEWKQDYPSHLVPKFSLFTDDGAVVVHGQNLSDLQNTAPTQQSTVQPTLSKADSALIEQWEGTAHRDWNFEGLPDEISTFTKTGEVSGFLYPALEPNPGKGIVEVKFLKDPEMAGIINTKGILFLLRLPFRDQYKALKKAASTQLTGPSTLFFAQLNIPKNERLDLVLEFTLKKILGPIPSTIVTHSIYSEMVNNLRAIGLFQSGQLVIKEMLEILRKRREVETFIKDTFSKGRLKGHFLPPREQYFLEQLETILPYDFLNYPHETDMPNILRSLRGLSIRMERFYANPLKDEEKVKKLQPHITKLNSLKENNALLSEEADIALREYQLMINEYTLSLFSPEIKTIRSVSDKKLLKQWLDLAGKC
jgi:ATP-dependent helicase HrpA